MNRTISMGNMTADPEIKETSTGKKYARFTLALQRMKEGADFPNFIAWEKKAEFMEKYCRKGMKLLVEGHILTGSYEGKNGKVYTTDIVCDNIEFCEKKKRDDGSEGQPKDNIDEGWMNVPDGIDEEMPFN